MKNKWEVIGNISVDGGMIRIGDPCYGETDEDVELFIASEEVAVEVPHEGDTKAQRGFGKAVILTSGLGDGVYSVEIKRDVENHGHIKEMRIKFY